MENADFISNIDSYGEADLPRFTAENFEAWLEIGFIDYPSKKRESFGTHLRFLIDDRDDLVSGLVRFYNQYLEDEQQRKKFRMGLAELLSRCPTGSLTPSMIVDMLTLSELIEAWEVVDKLESTIIVQDKWNKNEVLFEKIVSVYMRFASSRESVRNSLDRLIISNAVQPHQLGALLVAACIASPHKTKEYLLATTFGPRLNTVFETASNSDDAKSRLAGAFVDMFSLKKVVTVLLELLGGLDNWEYASLNEELWLVTGLFSGSSAPCKVSVSYDGAHIDYIVQCDNTMESIRINEMHDLLSGEISDQAFVRLKDLLLHHIPKKWHRPTVVQTAPISDVTSLDSDFWESMSVPPRDNRSTQHLRQPI